MKKTEAISILATSVRPREAKDRARYDEAVRMAIEALKCSETPKSSEQNAETAQPDHNADIGKKAERTAETAQNTSSCAHENDVIFRQAAIDAVEKSMYENPHENEIHRGMHDHEHRHFLTILMGLPSAQPEIIRCRDCKFAHITNDRKYCKFCDMFTDDYGQLIEMYFDSNFYCGYAERRTE